MISRLEPVPVLNGVARLKERALPFRLRALSAIVVLSAQSATAASSEIVFQSTSGDGEISVVVNGAAAIVFAFAAIDPGGGVVFIDNTAFVTAQDYADGFQTAADAQATIVAVAGVANHVIISTTNTGATRTISWAATALTTLPTGNGVGTDPGTLLPVLDLDFGGAGKMVKVFPELISNGAGGTYEFYFGEGVFPTVAVVPGGNTLVTIRLPENLGLVPNVVVTLTANSNATATLSQVFASLEEVMFDPDEDFEEWEDEE